MQHTLCVEISIVFFISQLKPIGTFNKHDKNNGIKVLGYEKKSNKMLYEIIKHLYHPRHCHSVGKYTLWD